MNTFLVFCTKEAADQLGVSINALYGLVKVLKKRQKLDRAYFTIEEIERIRQLQESFYENTLR
jgi:hypothetical protein